MFCPNCGADLANPLGSPAAEIEAAEVKIARINAERDIEVARISARQDKDWNATRLAETEMETDAELVAATTAATVMGDVLDTVAEGGGEEAPEIVNAPVADASDEEVADAPPPPVETEGSEPPAPAKKSLGIGAW